MCKSNRELLRKLQSLINRYRGAENFVHMMDEWPKTIRTLVFGSTSLMIRLGMMMPLDDYELPAPNGDSFESRMSECRKGDHRLKIVATYCGDNISGPSGADVTTIRWCEVCGSVVGDIDIDNRVQPGALFPMVVPEISK